MRRLVGVSSKTQKAIMGLMAVPIALTSIHMAAAARTASLQRQQEKLEQLTASPPPATLPSLPTPAISAALRAERRTATPAVPSGAANTVANAVQLGHRQIIISIADRKLALLEDGQVLKTWPIAVGTRGTPSPEGDFVIVNRAQDPVYRHGNKEVAPGKDNPLGTRWMGLSLKGYGIHGTNVQSSVGKAASHGCFRMRKQDVEELYTLVRVGDPVTVRRERDALIAQVFAPAPASAATVAALTAKSQGSAETQLAAVATVETGQE